MRSFIALSKAMLRGFFRDRTALFFTIFFPLMFLVIFGGIFKNTGTSKSEIIEIGQVAVLDNAPPSLYDTVLDIKQESDRNHALEAVRNGDVDAAVEANGNTLVMHYSASDAVRVGAVQSILQSIVDRANLGNMPITFTVAAEQVENTSLKAIQYVTPGMLSWAVSTGSTFGAALTLVSWRQKKILRRLRLSPARTSAIVGARIGVSLVLSVLQLAIFIGVASLPYFGLKLSAYWWMSIPIVFCGTLAFMSIGLVAGAFAKTPEAASGIVNLIVLPMAFLSGAFFPLNNAPGWLQAIAHVLPMQHMVTGLTNVMVRNGSILSAVPQMAILLSFAVVAGCIATQLFTWDDI